MTSYVRYVGRVGALAVALGIGSAIGAILTAFADGAGASTKAVAHSRRPVRPGTRSSAPAGSEPTTPSATHGF